MDANKWGERKEYIATCNSDLIKGMIKIRLHICELKKYCPREGEQLASYRHMKCIMKTEARPQQMVAQQTWGTSVKLQHSIQNKYNTPNQQGQKGQVKVTDKIKELSKNCKKGISKMKMQNEK